MSKFYLFAIILAFGLCLAFVFQAQADYSMDKLKTQQQLSQFKNQLQTKIQSTNTMAQENIQEKKEEALEYQEEHAVTTDVFDKMAKKSQESSFKHATKAYGLPLLIMAVIGVILLVVWHQNV